MNRPATDSHEKRFALARALWETGDTIRCEDVLRDLAARDPSREEVAALLAKLLQSQGRLDAASSVMFDLCQANALEPGLSLRGALFIQQCDRQPLASRLCEAVVANGQASADLLTVAGNIAREQGEFAQAHAHYLAALDAGVDLNSRYVLGALAHTLRYTDATHADFSRFEAHFRDATFSARARAATGFGLAKAHDDIGDYASAARVLREANALVRSVLPWSSEAWNDSVEVRQRERIARLPSVADPGFIPVFIVGLPRSGTTLAATRLARHAHARDRGELRMLRFIAEQLAGGDHLGDAHAISEAAELYRMHARQDDAPATWYIDQDPLNFRNLRLVEAMFPQARIIHCRRNRRDTALSLWCQDFAHRDGAFAYDFASIAHYAAGHDRLMQCWHRELSLPVHELDYEAVVADPQNELSKLCDFIGAPPAQSAPETVAPIGSASVWQARQPIYTTSIGRWRNYAPFVPELTRLLEVRD